MKPLTDAQWAAIVKIRPPLVPEPNARAALDRVREEYLKVDPKKLEAARRRLRRIVKIASGHLPAIHEHAESILKRHDRTIRERARKRYPEHPLLIGRLCDVWVDLYGGALTVDDWGDTPSGPLVRFILAATQGMFRPPINPHTIRYFVGLDREGREYLLRERPKMKKSEWD